MLFIIQKQAGSLFISLLNNNKILVSPYICINIMLTIHQMGSRHWKCLPDRRIHRALIALQNHSRGAETRRFREGRETKTKKHFHCLPQCFHCLPIHSDKRFLGSSPKEVLYWDVGIAKDVNLFWHKISRTAYWNWRVLLQRRMLCCFMQAQQTRVRSRIIGTLDENEQKNL